MTQQQKPSADGVYVGLASRYCAKSGWVLLPGVADGTGAHKSRTADALAMGCWRNTGFELHGFEIKVARSDFLREIKDPSKAESVAQFCDRWWLATPDNSVAKIEELPAGWGWITATAAEGCKVVKPAPEIPALPTTRHFMAAVLRAAQSRQPQIETIERELRWRLRKEIEADVDAKARANAEKHKVDANKASLYDHLQRRVDAFEQASGVQIDSYNCGRIGEAVQELLADRPRIIRRLRDEAEQMRVAAAAFLEATKDASP